MRSYKKQRNLPDPRGLPRTVKGGHANVWRLHLRDTLHTDLGQGDRPTKHGDAPVINEFGSKVTMRDK